MPSASLTLWTTDRIIRLAEIHAQCAATAAAIPPSPTLLDENVRGSILLLSAHFQGYCRDLYTECTQIIAARIAPRLRLLVQRQFEERRQLDHGNPNIDNLKKDFNRFGFRLNMAAHDPANAPRLTHLKDLNDWRNIAAHHGIVPAAGLPSLATVQTWQNSCDGLAASLDEIMYDQLRVVLGRRPWKP